MPAALLRLFLRTCTALLVAACSGGGSAPPPPAAPASTLAIFAGSIIDSGNVDGQGATARFDVPAAIAVHPVTGMVYVADAGNWTIRQVTPGGLVTTLAGAPRQFGFVDGVGSSARFGTVTALAVDASGVVYAADSEHFSIRRIEPDGRVTTWAGTGQRGTADGVRTGASFYNITALAIDPFSNLYVGDEYAIRKITPAGVVTTVAGQFGRLGLADGPGTSALLASAVYGLAADRSGNVSILEAGRLRKLGTDGILSTILGGEPRVILNPAGLAVDPDGSLYVSDAITHTIFRVSPEGQVFSPAVAGTGQAGVQDGARASATLRQPAIAWGQGRLFMAEPFDNVVRSVDLASGAIVTLAGTPAPNLQPELADGLGPAARFVFISQLVADGLGNLFVNDNARIRKVAPSGQVSTLSTAFLGSVNALAADTPGNLYVAQGLLCSDPGIRNLYPCGLKLHAIAPSGTSALLHETSEPLIPSALARDPDGNLYVAVPGPGTPTGRIVRVAPNGNASTFWTGAASGLAVDPAARVLYVADASRHVIVRITLGGEATVIDGRLDERGNSDGAGPDARFHSPSGLAVDPAGNLYVADTGNDLVRKVTAAGVVSTVAGTRGSRGFIAGSLPGLLKSPTRVAIVGSDLYIAMQTAIAVVRNRP